MEKTESNLNNENKIEPPNSNESVIINVKDKEKRFKGLSTIKKPIGQNNKFNSFLFSEDEKIFDSEEDNIKDKNKETDNLNSKESKQMNSKSQPVDIKDSKIKEIKDKKEENTKAKNYKENKNEAKSKKEIKEDSKTKKDKKTKGKQIEKIEEVKEIEEELEYESDVKGKNIKLIEHKIEGKHNKKINLKSNEIKDKEKNEKDYLENKKEDYKQNKILDESINKGVNNKNKRNTNVEENIDKKDNDKNKTIKNKQNLKKSNMHHKEYPDNKMIENKKEVVLQNNSNYSDNDFDNNLNDLGNEDFISGSLKNDNVLKQTNYDKNKKAKKAKNTNSESESDSNTNSNEEKIKEDKKAAKQKKSNSNKNQKSKEKEEKVEKEEKEEIEQTKIDAFLNQGRRKLKDIYSSSENDSDKSIWEESTNEKRKNLGGKIKLKKFKTENDFIKYAFKNLENLIPKEQKIKHEENPTFGINGRYSRRIRIPRLNVFAGEKIHYIAAPDNCGFEVASIFSAKNSFKEFFGDVQIEKAKKPKKRLVRKALKDKLNEVDVTKENVIDDVKDAVQKEAERQPVEDEEYTDEEQEDKDKEINVAFIKQQNNKVNIAKKNTNQNQQKMQNEKNFNENQRITQSKKKDKNIINKSNNDQNENNQQNKKIDKQANENKQKDLNKNKKKKEDEKEEKEELNTEDEIKSLSKNYQIETVENEVYDQKLTIPAKSFKPSAKSVNFFIYCQVLESAGNNKVKIGENNIYINLIKGQKFTIIPSSVYYITNKSDKDLVIAVKYP